MERAGLISDLEHFPMIYLSPARFQYTADFKYKNLKLNEFEWEEVKGYEGETWKRNKRLWPHYGPGRLIVTAYDAKTKRSIVKQVINLKVAK